MRIVHAFHHYYPFLGGMERVIQGLAEEQVKLGHDVYVVTSKYGADGSPVKETINGVHIHRVKAFRLHYPDLTVPKKIPTEMLRKADVVHTHGQNSFFNIILAKAAKRIGKSLVMEFLALEYLKSHTNPLVRYLGGYYQERVQREAVKLVDGAVTTNERDYEILKEKYGVESKIVPHGINEKYLMKPKYDDLFREKYGIYGENIVAYVGRVHPSKGLDTLIAAVPFVAREVDDFIVVIAGGDSEPYKKTLNNLAKRFGVGHKVKLLGYISDDEKISLLDSSKFFIFPTRHFGEAYPLVVDEAYARGVPIVATEVGALPYRVKHMKTGMLVPPDNPKLLAESVVTLLREDDLLTRIREGLCAIKGSLLTWRQICERLDNIYESVL